MTANTPKTRKAKGRVFQQQIREDILEAMDLDPKDVLSTPMGQAGPDIYFAARAQLEFPFAVECKHQERLNIWEALRQADENAGRASGTTVRLNPLLVVKRSRGQPYAVLAWSDFLEMAGMAYRSWSR